MQKTSDINVVETRTLPSPAALLKALPKNEVQSEFITRARREIHQLIFTDDKRFLLIVGPCSIHRRRRRPRLCPQAGRPCPRRSADRIMIVMRVLF
ncbi:MAG: hypothetical protein WDM96_14205 [Lacunisphaera sp.]